jgi:hypothetical protein
MILLIPKSRISSNSGYIEIKGILIHSLVATLWSLVFLEREEKGIN